MDSRLVAAACSKHIGSFDNMCVHCVRRYYNQLIDDTYVPRHVYESQALRLQAAEARVRSLEVELKPPPREPKDVGPPWMKPGEAEGWGDGGL